MLIASSRAIIEELEGMSRQIRTHLSARYRSIALLILLIVIAATSAMQPRASAQQGSVVPATAPQGGPFMLYLPSIVTAGEARPGLPQIASFSAAPASIAPGGSTALSWSTSGATSLRITPAIGPVTGTSVVVQPDATT